jgi:hypothetical protein
MITKELELKSAHSCLNSAAMDEPVFVLRAKDITAPKVIEDWVVRRIQAGKNKAGDYQTTDALAVAKAMTDWQKINLPPRERVV